MRRSSAVLATLLLALTGRASAEPARTMTIGEFLVTLPLRSVDPVIEHCSESVPEMESALLIERAGFLDKLIEAGHIVSRKMENDPTFNAPLEDAVRHEIDKRNFDALNILKKQEPNLVCRTVLHNIQRATVDELSKVVEDTYIQFRGAEKGQSSE